MKIAQIVRGAAAALFFCLTSPLVAAIQLMPVVSGLASPTLVTNAADGSNRLFIVEQGGTIRVLQPGSTTPTLFLDIHANVLRAANRDCSVSRSIRSIRQTAAFSFTTRM
jgi:hypothetical protein